MTNKTLEERIEERRKDIERAIRYTEEALEDNTTTLDWMRQSLKYFERNMRDAEPKTKNET